MRYKVLFIDENNPTVGKRIISALTGEGFEVTTATTFEEALSGLDEPKPELIILGEGLPDSFEACSQLRQVVDVPILMLGTGPRNAVWTRVVEVQADFYLVRPFGYSELVARIKALLRRYQMSKNKNNKWGGDHIEA